jgi:hypothetical protein
MDKLYIGNEMAQFDKKNRDFYDSLTDEEKKKFSPYLMIRWGSSVQGERELQEYYVMSTNQRLNKHYFSVNRHPKLQWLMATAVSPDMGTHRHQWIAPKKKGATGGNEVKKTLVDLFPNMKMRDIECLATMTDKKELKDYLREHGNPDKD